MSAPQIVGQGPMEGRGVYNANSALQATGGTVGLPLLEQAAAEIAPSDDDRRRIRQRSR